ncbi:hypothetical protein F511_17455 [Dorcoceras hygrometricum]|uniref:Uncharacterized protein n=1 Tax=Dorcoceras hygrometricum TaxID=472368 RepID=A0A2Z7CIP8_9LAMI|nr:hypothetical protein F511_17455 [Dorcoceras hygrometricum]
MKKSSEARRSSYLQSEQNRELFQKLDILEKDYRESLQKPNNPKNKCRDSTSSSYGANVSTSLDELQLLENSPRELMTSLQSKISPFDAISNARNRDATVEEVIMDRRDVIMSGKLQGRRLVFDSIEVENHARKRWENGDYGDDSGVVMQEREVIMNENSDGKMSRSRSCTFSGSISSEEVVIEEEKTVVEVRNVAEKGGLGRLRGGGGGRCMVMAMAWSVILLFVIIFGLISIRCNGKPMHAELAPT